MAKFTLSFDVDTAVGISKYADHLASIMLVRQSPNNPLVWNDLAGSEIDQNPEQITRDEIDARLTAAGSSVQPDRAIKHSAVRGIALREYQTSVGPSDYTLFAAKRAFGIVEAKLNCCGTKLTTVEDQSAGYASAQLNWVKNPEPLPVIYEATG